MKSHYSGTRFGEAGRNLLSTIFSFRFIFSGLAFAVFLSGCGPGKNEMEARESKMADSVSSLIGSSAATITKADSDHTFIRTADIKFKVKDVRKATFTIEDIVSRHNGFVAFTSLSGTVSYRQETKVTEDSLLEATHYNVDNSLTIRVPNTQLDSVLRQIAPLMEFLDHRTIKAEDIKLTLLSNQLAEKRFVQHKQRITSAIKTQGKKLPETADTEDGLLVKQERADNTRIETMDLLDQVNYSTVTLYIYQPETISYVMTAGPKSIVPYKPSFGKQLGEAFVQGWHLFEELILFFTQMWGVLLIALLLFFAIRRFANYLSKPDVKKA